MMDVADGLVVSALTLGILVHEGLKRSRARDDRLARLEPEVEALRNKLDAARHLSDQDVTAEISEYRPVSISFVEETLSVGLHSGEGEAWYTEYRVHRIGADDDRAEDTLGRGRWFIKSMRVGSFDPAKGMAPTVTETPGRRWEEADEDLALFAEGAFRQWREMRRVLRGDPLVVPGGPLDDEVMREGSRGL